MRPRFGVDGYVDIVTTLYDRLLTAKARGMKLGIVYHMPFWHAADGTLREAEGSFARYVDSLAPYFDEVSLASRCSMSREARAPRFEPGT